MVIVCSGETKNAFKNEVLIVKSGIIKAIFY
ncbi:hypothetical protein FVP09_04385 [Vibrio parahaemolyticus]|nr:hypothetical protein FVP09_04385 [Vibrio parahaemolyticus]